MKIKTKYHGEVMIDQNEVIYFAQGIPGFLDEKEFIFLPFSDDGIYKILQSVTNPHLAFVSVNPFAFFPDYDFELDEQATNALELDTEKDIDLNVILTLNDSIEKTTANLQAPVLINRNKKLGKQVILVNSSYTTKHLLFSQDRG